MNAESIDSYKPVSERDRIDGLDVARGFALLGILVMNATSMALMNGAYFNPAIDGGNTGADLWAWLFMMIYAEASMRTLFSLLFGAGMVLFLQRLERQRTELQPVDVHARRMLWLLAFGLVNMFVIVYPYDILQLYAIAGLLLYPFRVLSARALLALSIVLFVISFAWDSHGYLDQQASKAEYEQLIEQRSSGTELDEEQVETIEAWEDELRYMNPDEEMRAEKVAQKTERNPLKLWANLAGDYIGFYTSEDFWRYLLDAVAAIALGMALFRAGVMSGQASAGLNWALLIFGYGIGLGLGWWRAHALMESGFDRWALEPHFLLYDLRRVGIALGHLAMVQLLCLYDVLGAVRRMLANIGRMALTNYLTQSVLLVFSIYGVGLSLYQQLQRHEILYLVAGIWVFQAVFSAWWLKGHRFGPLEWLWRSLTYWKRQPLRRG